MKRRTIVYVATAVVAASVAFAFVACSDTSAPPANAHSPDPPRDG